MTWIFMVRYKILALQGNGYTIGFGTCSGKIVPAAPWGQYHFIVFTSCGGRSCRIKYLAPFHIACFIYSAHNLTLIKLVFYIFLFYAIVWIQHWNKPILIKKILSNSTKSSCCTWYSRIYKAIFVPYQLYAVGVTMD